MLQAFVQNVSSVFQSYVAIVFYLDVAYVSHIFCNSMFQMFQLFQSYVAASDFKLQIAILDVSCV